ncbi:MAG: hypothetical protein IJD24_05050 [Agathobacter sp.]|nr:hypothetical protein [Agathobacter sp.]
MKKFKQLVAFLIFTMMLSGCGGNVVSSSLTPKQIIDSEEIIIGYLVAGDLTEESIPQMYFAFQNGNATVYQGENCSMYELATKTDEEILELLQEREHYDGKMSATIYKNYLSSKTIAETIDFSISYGMSETILNWSLNVNDTEYCAKATEINGSKYYRYTMTVGNIPGKCYLCFRTDAENFSLGFDTSSTDGIKVENIGGF